MPTFRLSHARFGTEVNICFVNSVIQLLHCLPVIKNYFLNQVFQHGQPMQLPAGMYRICSEIKAIFGFSGVRQITSAGALRQIIGSKRNQEHFNDQSQQDAVDFMQVLLSNIESEVGCQAGEAGARVDGDHRNNCVVSLIQGVERYQYNFRNSVDGSCPMCGAMQSSREVKFEIFHLDNNDKSKAISIQELIDDNLTLPSEVLKKRCSQCTY